MSINRAADMPEKPEPMLAAVYKLVMFLEHEDDPQRPWDITDKVNWILSKPRGYSEGVSYAFMRDYINDFMKRRLGEFPPPTDGRY